MLTLDHGNEPQASVVQISSPPIEMGSAVQYLAAPQHPEGGRARGLTATSREPVDCACWYSTVRHKIAVVAVTPPLLSIPF
jgi:hypothetical protein